MKYFLYFLFFLNNFIFSQTKIDIIKEHGYTSEKGEKNYISSDKLQSLINKNIFEYFDELNQFDTPLKIKLYKTDHKEEYLTINQRFHDDFNYYKSRYEYNNVLIHVENYDTATNSFKIGSIYDEIEFYNSWWENNKIENVLVNNLDLALEIENNKNEINSLVILDRFQLNNLPYSKIIFYTKNTIIGSLGKHNYIDSILNLSDSICEVGKIKPFSKRYGKNDTIPAEFINYPSKNINSYMSENIVFPEDSLGNVIEGKVYVSFVIGIYGEIKDVKIVKGTNNDLNREVIRVIKNMKYWKPATCNNVNVEYKFLLPVIFKLDDIPQKSDK